MTLINDKNPSVSIREAARKAGVSHTAINKAIELGKFTKCVDRSGKKPKIRYGEFLEEAVETGFNLKGTGNTYALPDVSDMTDEERESIEALTVETATFKESSRREAYYRSELKRIELEEKEGTLVNKADTQRLQFEWARELRDKLLAIPDRITDTLMYIDDRDEFHHLLYNSIRDLLVEFATREEKIYYYPRR
jgi:hypothetical protein